MDTPTQVERIRGVVPLQNVGTLVISDVTYAVLLVAGHACADPPILDLYVTRGDDAAQASIDPALNAVTVFDKVPETDFTAGKWLAPGKPNWPLATTYYDRTAPDGTIRRYTEVYCALDPLPDEMFADINGAETVGDGSGDVIADLAEQDAHCWDNYVEGDYQSGAYLPVARYDDGVAKRNETAFETVTSRGVTKFPPDGLVGAWGVGGDGRFLTVRALRAMLNRSGNYQSYWNARMQLAIDLFLDAATVDAPHYTDARDIFADRFRADVDDGALHNVVPYQFRRHWGTGDFEGTGEVTDADSIRGYGDDVVRSVAPIRELGALRDPSLALSVAEDYLVLHADPPVLATIGTGWRGLSDELGDVIDVTHVQGPSGDEGYALTPCRIERHEVDPNEFAVTFQARNIERLVEA